VLSGLLRGKLCEQLARRPSRHAPSGRLLYFVGESAKSLYFLKTGLVKTSRTTSTGDEMILQIHQPGEIFGELCFCTGERHEQAIALESSEIVEISLVELLAQLQRTPEAALDLITALCERLGDARDRLQSIAFESVPERLARTLLILADTLGEDTPEGTHIVHYVRQEELAQMVAARREVVSGLLNRLRERGLISYSRKGEITVHRVPLQAYLESLGRATGK
jgi:CRP/FNR family transcriptional regulator